MYEIHKKLKNQTENIHCFIDQFSIEVKDKRNKTPNLFSTDEDTFDLINENTYNLLEAIHLVSQKPLHVLINELEIRYSKIIYKYALYYYKMPKTEFHNNYDELSNNDLLFKPFHDCTSNEEEDEDEVIENFYLDLILRDKIDQINTFCNNYLGIEDSVLLSHNEYKIIALSNIFQHALKVSYSSFSSYIESFNSQYEFLTGKTLTKEEITFLEREKDFVKSPIFRINFSKNSLLPKGVKYMDSNVLETLRRYLIDEEYLDNTVSNFDFVYLSQQKKLPKNIQKLNWKKKPANACRFADFLGMKYEDFNQCFVLHNKKPLTSSNKSTYGYPPFAEFLDNLL